MTTEYQPVTVDAAREIARKFAKSMVVILAQDDAAGLTHATSYAVEPADKPLAATLAETCMVAIGGDLSRRTTFEDYRTVPAAEAAAKIDGLLAACRSARAFMLDALRDLVDVAGFDPAEHRVVKEIDRAIARATGGA